MLQQFFSVFLSFLSLDWKELKEVGNPFFLGLLYLQTLWYVLSTSLFPFPLCSWRLIFSKLIPYICCGYLVLINCNLRIASVFYIAFLQAFFLSYLFMHHMNPVMQTWCMFLFLRVAWAFFDELPRDGVYQSEDTVSSGWQWVRRSDKLFAQFYSLPNSFCSTHKRRRGHIHSIAKMEACLDICS